MKSSELFLCLFSSCNPEAGNWTAAVAPPSPPPFFHSISSFCSPVTSDVYLNQRSLGWQRVSWYETRRRGRLASLATGGVGDHGWKKGGGGRSREKEFNSGRRPHKTLLLLQKSTLEKIQKHILRWGCFSHRYAFRLYGRRKRACGAKAVG